MLPRAHSRDDHRLLGRVGPRLGWSTLATALACWLWLAAENGAEQVTTGWAVGTPTTSNLQPPPPDPELHGILHHVLQQAEVPILRENRPSPAPPIESGTRIAERTAADDGWRARGLPLGPRNLPTPGQVEHKAASPIEGDSHGDASSTAPTGIAAPANRGVTEQNGPTASQVNSPMPLRPPEPADDTTAPAESIADEEETESPPTQDSLDQSAEDGEAEFECDAQGSDGGGDSSEAIAGSPASDTAKPEETPESESTAAGPVDEEQESSAASTPAAPPVKSPPPLTRQLMNLRSRVRSVLRGYYRKPLNSREHDTWEAMHGMLAYGIHSRILQGSPRGTPITAVGWLCYNKPCKGLTLLYVTPQGELRAKWGVGLQGHSGQFLAMLAQCNVSPEYPIFVGKKEFTIRDLIDAEKKTCYPKSELTFKLIALQHYLDLNERWVNDQGSEWDLSRLIREEISQPIRGAACGGTHRLSGLSLTVKARLRRGEPLDGEYARAAEFVEKYEQYAFRLQNRDGSLSTEWFRGRGDDDDIDRRIKTTGHILEWLCYTLSDEELRQPRTVRAVWYLATLMYSNYDHDWEVGPRSHALHALVRYDERVFRPFDEAGVVSFKTSPSTASQSHRRNWSRR